MAHCRIAVDVVPDRAHRLFEGPRLAALPLKVIAARRSRSTCRGFFEKMPGANQIESGIRWAQTTDIDDPSQASLRDQHVARNEITVSHDISSDTRKLANAAHIRRSRGTSRSARWLEAGLHPWIVGVQVSTPTRSSERPTEGID